MSFLNNGKLVLLLITFMSVVILLKTTKENDEKDKSNGRKTQWQRAFDEKLKQLIGDKSNEKNDDNKDSFKKRIYVRHRLINDIGIVVADEQPDLADIKLMIDKVENDKKERQFKNKTRQIPIVTEQIIPSIIEHDPTIDENAIGLSYKYYENSKER